MSSGSAAVSSGWSSSNPSTLSERRDTVLRFGPQIVSGQDAGTRRAAAGMGCARGLGILPGTWASRACPAETSRERPQHCCPPCVALTWRASHATGSHPGDSIAGGGRPCACTKTTPTLHVMGGRDAASRSRCCIKEHGWIPCSAADQVQLAPRRPPQLGERAADHSRRCLPVCTAGGGAVLAGHPRGAGAAG